MIVYKLIYELLPTVIKVHIRSFLSFISISLFLLFFQVVENIWVRDEKKKFSFVYEYRFILEDTYAIALQRLNPSDKESPISLAYFGIFDGHGGKEAADFARQHLCQHILEQDDFWSENSNDKQILAAIRKGFLSCHNDMWNHVDKWAKTSSGMTSTSGKASSTKKNNSLIFRQKVVQQVLSSSVEINCTLDMLEIPRLSLAKAIRCIKIGKEIESLVIINPKILMN